MNGNSFKCVSFKKTTTKRIGNIENIKSSPYVCHMEDNNGIQSDNYEQLNTYTSHVTEQIPYCVNSIHYISTPNLRGNKSNDNFVSGTNIFSSKSLTGTQDFMKVNVNITEVCNINGRSKKVP